MLSKIEEIIDENVRPALAGDGGGLEVLAYQDGVLTVHYQGACGSCPSASAGTLYAIQNLLQRMLDPKIQVVSV
jgi:Fe-S cluster biogenesis protein NfuA